MLKYNMLTEIETTDKWESVKVLCSAKNEKE